MPKNVELVQQMFGSQNPLPSIELADNALKLAGIAGNLYALKSDLNGEVNILLGNIQDVIDDLEAHKADDVRHLTQGQIDKISAAINATQALQIANQAIATAEGSIEAIAVASAVAQSKDYTDTKVGNAVAEIDADKQDKLTFDNTPTQNSTNPVTSGGIYNALQTHVEEEEYTDPVTGETEVQPLNEALVKNPQARINPECFFRFKNMIDNSSLEVLDGSTNIPLGWDNGISSPDASMFGTRSLKLTTGQIAKQTGKFQASWQWFKDNVYNTTDAIFCFYHKFDAVKVKIYDVTNEEYMTLTLVKPDLTEEESTTEIIFTEEENWSQYRCMVKFTPKSNTTYIRPEFQCQNGTNGMCFVDAFMLEPFVSGEFPSMYRDGRYSVAAYQILNPPPRRCR